MKAKMSSLTIEETITLTDEKIKVAGNVDKYKKMFAGTYKLVRSFVFDNVKVLNYEMEDNINVISELDLSLRELDRALPLPEWYIDERMAIVSFIDKDKLYVIAYDGLDEQIVIDELRKINDNLYLFHGEIAKLIQLQEMHDNVFRGDDAEVEINLDCNDLIIDVDDTIRLIVIKSSETRVVMNVYEKIK